MQYLECNFLLLVTSASDLLVRTIRFRSAVFGVTSSLAVIHTIHCPPWLCVLVRERAWPLSRCRTTATRVAPGGRIPASLTHCCAWPAEGRSVLHIERSWPAIRARAAPTDRPMSSSTYCRQFLRGRSGGRFQSAAGGVPVWASIDSCSACEAGVFSSRRQMWPNNEWRLSAIRDGTSGSFVLSLTTALDTLSYHLIPRIRRSACIWKDWILSLSSVYFAHCPRFRTI